MSFQTILKVLTPEIVLSGFAFLVLILDIFLFRQKKVEWRHEMIGRILLAGLAACFLIFFMRIGSELEATSFFTLGNGTFVVSPLNTVLKLLVMAVAFLIILMGLSTPYSSHVGEYYSLFAFSLLGMLFLISSEDLLMIFLALELMSLTLYGLAAFQKGALRSIEAGMKYFLFGGLSAAFLLFGLSYIYGATGHTSLREIANTLGTNAVGSPSNFLLVGILFTLVGLGFKIAAVPFHLWAPDAYEGAPTPVTSLIATGSKIASFLVLVKLFLFCLVSVAGATYFPGGWKPGWTAFVAILAAASMILGNVAAIAQKNVKRLLAYSSVAHAGYILVALVAVNEAGIPAKTAAPAIFFYVLIYALTNVCALGVVNTVAWRVGGDEFNDFTGLSKRSPFLAFILLICLFSLAGIPPLAGFFGKFYLFFAAVQADPANLGLLWLVILAIAMSAVSLYYYLKLAKQMYVISPVENTRIGNCFTTNTALAILCSLVLLFGVFPGKAIAFFSRLDYGAAAKVPAATTSLESTKPTFQAATTK